MGRRSPQSVLKRAREQAMRDVRSECRDWLLVLNPIHEY
jgi:hypothetical protein